ncbi:hypothetical protein [Cylindrospermopsis raciborskii]|uniref:hypothetical protein n=1 Tax=Cylindrospermopsis raciborskii TaxID=77022 RepID=UPI003DA520B3
MHYTPDGRSRSTPDGRSLSSRKENLYLGAFHVRFPVGKRLTVNVFRQRINQLFQGGGDIWRGIAQHSLRDLAFRVPRVPSQGKNLNVLRGDPIQGSPCFFSREKPERVEGRLHYTPDGRSLLVIIPRFLLKGKI